MNETLNLTDFERNEFMNGHYLGTKNAGICLRWEQTADDPNQMFDT